MLTYYFIAASTTIVAYLSSVAWKRSRVVGVLLLVAVAVIFSYYAGARDNTVGTDMEVYGLGSYESARLWSFQDFMEAERYERWGVLMKGLMWWTAYLTKSSFWYFFVIQLVTVVPVLIAARWQVREWVPLAVMVYALVFYPQSFNLMRQFASMGFVLLSFGFARKLQPVQFIVLVLVGVGFHSSAYIGLGVYPIVWYARKGHMSSGIKTLALGVVTIVALLFAQQLLTWLTSATGLFESYVTGSAVTDGGGLRTVLEFVLEIVFLTAVGAIILKGHETSEATAQLAILVLFGGALYFLSMMSNWLYRISLFFMYFAILLLPEATRQIEDRPMRLLYMVVAAAALAFFAYVYFGLQHCNEVVPYVFETVFLH